MLASLREDDSGSSADQDSRRAATPQERAVLARWSGWGAVGQLFDKDEFAAQRAELQALLTEEQYAAARLSTINAHYTDGSLVATIWDGLHRLGFTGGAVLEPGCGSGHFIGLAPDSAQMTGVEREPVSAAIAAALYPHAEVVTADFAKIDANENTFDATVGNVPFGTVHLGDDKYNPGRRHSIHNHFILKSLYLTRPGGMMAVLTSRYTLDRVNPEVRAEMAQLADLVGAVRLPTGAHHRAAGTAAVTDLLILRRRDPDTEPVVPFDSWEKALPHPVGDAGSLVEINKYFLDHPENVLGEFTLGHGMYAAEELKVRGNVEALGETFAAAVHRIADEAVERGLVMTPRTHTPVRPASTVTVIDPDAAQFEGSLAALPDGTFTRRVGSDDVTYTPPATQAGELRALLTVRDAAMALIRAEQASIDDTPQIRDLRSQLNAVYDTYVAEFGPVNRFTERRQMRQAWHVFGEWCDRHNRDKVPATTEAVTAYLSDLRGKGLGQDLLQRHLDAMVKNHQTAFDKAVQKAATQVAAKRAALDHELDPERLERTLLRDEAPGSLLRQAQMPDPRLSASAVAAGKAIVAGAPETTDPELDYDALGLRTTIIVRPPQGGFRDDPFANVARALEKFDPTTQTARKADIFTRRVINPPRTRYGADTPEEALSICLDTHSRVDLPEIARLLGLPGEEEARAALGELVFDDPDTGEPVWAPFYLAGNVRQKLARAQLAAEADPRFAVNVTALERVIPADLGPEDIEVRLGSWIGPEYVQAFLRELLDDEHVLVENVAGMWLVATNKAKHSKATTLAANNIWGGGGLDAYELTERLLVGAPIRVMMQIDDETEVLDQEATEEARDKAGEISDRFADWVWENTDRAQRVMRVYNDTFNAEVPVDYTGIELSLPGLSQAFTLREHQKIAIARVIYQGGTGLVHEVGAGKTLEMIVGVMERHRRGLANKPVVVVPNDSIAEQFEREWLQAYPGARLLTGTSTDLASDKKKGSNGRAEFVARVATGEWDAVIMTKESFQSIPLPAEIQERFLNAELDDLRAEKDAHAATMSDSMTKRIESAMENAKQRLEKRLNEIPRDTAGMTFVDAGFDFVVVDEAQNYKNGLINSAIPDLEIEGSNRAIDLDMKLGHLQDRFGSARVVLATATPWTGKFSEVYLWQRRLGHHMPRFDQWARTYVTQETYLERTPGGTLRGTSRTRRVINEPELWRALRLTSDIKMKRDLNLKVPLLRGGKIDIIEVPAPVQARIFTLDIARRERIQHGKPEKGDDNHLVREHDAQLAAIDLRTVGITTPQPQKVDVVAADIFTEWEASKDNVYSRDDGTEHPVRGGLILVFCDESTPSRHWNFYTELREQLVSRGMDENTIRFIHEAASPQRKADLLAAGREGAISVLVGSTMKMGAGINVQDRVIGGYEITGQWRPDITAQAIGRAERQGNQNPEYFWKRVVLAPSGDAKKWEITSQKHNMFAPLYSSTPPERTREVKTEEADSLADVMAAATGDPRYKEKAELDTELTTLTRQRSSHARTQQALKLSLARSSERIPQLQERAERQDAVAAQLVSTEGEKFAMRVGRHTITKRADAAEAVRDLLTTTMATAPRTRDGLTVPIGTIGGFDVTATCYPLNRAEAGIRVDFPAATENTPGFYLDATNLPGGIGPITRLENQLKTIAAAGDRTREDIRQEQASIEQARPAIGKPFAGEVRLAEVQARRAELIAQLSPDDDEDRDPNEDPDSPAAIARRERAEARRQELDALLDSAREMAELVGFDSKAAAQFGSWYAAITGPVTADQRPPVEPALDVWLSIGQPGSEGRTRLEPYGATARPDATPEPVSAQVEEADPAVSALPTAAGTDERDTTRATSSGSPLPSAPDTSATVLDDAQDSDEPEVLEHAGEIALGSLPSAEPAQQWQLLRRELTAAGFTHLSRDDAGRGGIDYDLRQVLTDSGDNAEHELRVLAAHVEELREHLNTPAAAETIDAIVGSDAANDPDRHGELIQMIVRAGLHGSAARWFRDRLRHIAALHGIATSAPPTPDTAIQAPNGNTLRTDADLDVWANYSRAPMTCGDLEIAVLESPARREAQITPTGGRRPSSWVTLPPSTGEQGRRALDTITTTITTAGQEADRIRTEMIRELARTLPLTPTSRPTEQRHDPTVPAAVSLEEAPQERLRGEQRAPRAVPGDTHTSASSTDRPGDPEPRNQHRGRPDAQIPAPPGEVAAAEPGFVRTDDAPTVLESEQASPPADTTADAGETSDRPTPSGPHHGHTPAQAGDVEFGVTVDHPAVVAVRDAVARAPLGADSTATASNRHRMAAAAVDLYVTTPEGVGARTVVRSIATQTGTGVSLIPRWLDLSPTVEWPHWVRTLNQAARIAELTGGLDDMGGRMRQAAQVMSDRVAATTHTPADVLAQTGMAAIDLVPAGHPAAPPLLRQLQRARFNHRVTGEDYHAKARALILVADILDRPDLIPEAIARQAVHGQPYSRLRHWDTVTGLRTLADMVETAGYTDRVAGRDSSAPQVFRHVADAVAALLADVPRSEPLLAQEVPEQVPSQPRPLYPGERVGPVERELNDLSETGEDRQATEQAASTVDQAVRQALARLDQVDADRVRQGLAAVDAGRGDEAQLHLCWALRDDPTIGRGFREAQEILHLLLSQTLATEPRSLTWLARYPLTYAHDSAPHIAANLVGWSAALRARATTGDELARLLQAAPLRQITSDLDAVAATMAQQDRFTLPAAAPIPLVQESLFDVVPDAVDRPSTPDTLLGEQQLIRADSPPAAHRELTAEDIEDALTSFPRNYVPLLIAGIADPAALTALGREHASYRGATHDPSGIKDIRSDRQGFTVRITTAEWIRSGRLTWAQASAWLAHGLAPTRRRTFLDARTVAGQFRQAMPGYRLLGQADLAEQAIFELKEMNTAAAAQTLRAARVVHEHGQGSNDARDVPTADEQAVLDRIHQLAAVLPPSPIAPPTVLEEFTTGDVVTVPGDRTLLRLTEPPTIHDGWGELVGVNATGHDSTTAVRRTIEPDRDGMLTALPVGVPGSLEQLITLPADGDDEIGDGPDQQPQSAPEAPDLPTLRSLRALASEYDLQVGVVRVGDAAFVTVHEAAAPTPPVLCWPLGSHQIVDGAGIPMPVPAAADYLSTYRDAVDAALFTAKPGLRDWPRRLAQLAAHTLSGSDPRNAVRTHIDEALTLLGADDAEEAERVLRRAEDIAGPLTMTPEREAQVVREVQDHASGYAWAGDVGRYLTAPRHLDGSVKEWEWINAYVRDHPETLQGHPDHDRIRARNAAERAEQEQLGATLHREATAAYQAGDFERALDLLDQAELAHPASRRRWGKARDIVTEAMTGGEPPAADNVPATGDAEGEAGKARPGQPEQSSVVGLPAQRPAGHTGLDGEQTQTDDEVDPTREMVRTSDVSALEAVSAPAESDPAPETAVVDSDPAEQLGPWTRRIAIEVSGNTAMVSGTSSTDPPMLRQALKRNGFWWRPQEGEVWKYFYRRGGVSRDEAVLAIRDVLAELDAREAAKASPAPSHPPTAQQQAIIDACVDGRDVAVRALAGTGKTSTMRMVAARMPDKTITYIAFNRSIADEAQAAFGRNVRADTMHAFARQALRSSPRYQAKLGMVARNDGFPQEVAAVLGLGAEDTVPYGRQGAQHIEALRLVRMAMGTVKRFRESADAEIGRRHVGDGATPDQPGLSALVLKHARQIWADKASPSGKLRFTHDDYLKIWALGNPTIPGDVIIFDEVQDVNELQARLVQAQGAQTIVVGDSYQSVYGFRGAKDFLRHWPADVTLPLTKSWRFGPVVAGAGNRFLGLLRSQLVLEGNPALDTRLERVEHPDAVLCRTNAGAVAAVFAGIEEGKRVALVGGGGAIKDIARAAKDLQRGRGTKHADLSRFANWHDVRDYVNKNEDAQSLRMFVRLIDKHQPDGLIAMADELIDENETDPDIRADLVVSTAHKAKGREWHDVRIADDFRGPTQDPETGETVLPSPEELRLAYVTVTRAQRRLELGSLEWILDYSEPNAVAEATPIEEQQENLDADVVHEHDLTPLAEPIVDRVAQRTIGEQGAGESDLHQRPNPHVINEGAVDDRGEPVREFAGVVGESGPDVSDEVREWVLWGFSDHTSPVPIKLTGGSRQHCHSERQSRERDGWTCDIYRAGEAPDALRARAHEALRAREETAAPGPSAVVSEPGQPSTLANPASSEADTDSAVLDSTTAEPVGGSAAASAPSADGDQSASASTEQPAPPTGETAAEQGALIDTAALASTGPARSWRSPRRGESSPVLGAAGLEVWQAFHRTAAEGAEPPTTAIPRRRIDGEITVRPGYRRVITDAGWPPPGEGTAPRGPLTQADVGLALLRVASFAPSAFGQIVARADEPGEWAPGFIQGHRVTWRGEDEPDAGQADRVVAWGTHVEVEVGHLRSGAVRWNELAAWLRPGLSDDHAEFFAQAVPVWRRFHQRHDRVVLSPEATSAGQELLQVLDTVVAEVLTRALRAHLAPAGQQEPAVPSVVAKARERVAALAEAAPAEAERAPAGQRDGAEHAGGSAAASAPSAGDPSALASTEQPDTGAPAAATDVEQTSDPDAPMGETEATGGDRDDASTATNPRPLAEHTTPPTTEHRAAEDPDIPVTDRITLIDYVLGERRADKEMRGWVSIVLSRRARAGVYPVQALRLLQQAEDEVYRRAATAMVGSPHRRGESFDYDRARAALQRLSGDDPTLPVNAIGQYVTLEVNEPQPVDEDGWIPVDQPASVRGVVVQVEPEPLTGFATVLIERDVIGVNGAPRAQQKFALDSALPLLDRDQRPSDEDRAAQNAARQPLVAARQRATGLPAAPEGPPASERGDVDSQLDTGQGPAVASPQPSAAGQKPDDTQPETVPLDLRLPDGRELVAVGSPDAPVLPSHIGPTPPSYVRLEPGRFRLVIGQLQPPLSEGLPWWWALHRIDDHGNPVGASIQARTTMHASADAAARAAARRLAALERHLDTDTLVGSPVAGPMAQVEFVEGWGDVATQLQNMSWPRFSEEDRAAEEAFRLTMRTIGEPHPDLEAEWLLQTRQVDPGLVAGQLRDLVTVIGQSGLSDRLSSRAWPRLSPALAELAREIDGRIAAVEPVQQTPARSTEAAPQSRDHTDTVAAAEELLEQARHAYLARDYTHALALIDEAERVDPDNALRWAEARKAIRQSPAQPNGSSAPDRAARAEVPSEETGAQESQGRATAVQEPLAMTLSSSDYELDLLARVNAAAAAWFVDQLDASPRAQDYLRERLGGEDAVRRVRFGAGSEGGLLLGYAPPGWTNLVDHLRKEKFTDDQLVRAGVASVSQHGRLIDRFRHRLMFGIRDLHGRVAGFTGRALSTQDEQKAKYLNTSATPLFDKSALMFGLWEQRDAASQAVAVVVEGPMDVAAIIAHQPGHRPLLPVAACGTALTSTQLDTLDQLVPVERRHVFAFDPDGAGRKAAVERAERALTRYPDLHIVQLPDGQDPAEYAVTVTAEENARAYLDSPHTRPAREVLIDARLVKWAEHLDKGWVEGYVGAGRDIAPLLASAPADQLADLILATATRHKLDPVALPEFVADLRARDPNLLHGPAPRPVLSTESHRDSAEQQGSGESQPDHDPGQPIFAEEVDRDLGLREVRSSDDLLRVRLKRPGGDDVHPTFTAVDVTDTEAGWLASDPHDPLKAAELQVPRGAWLDRHTGELLTREQAERLREGWHPLVEQAQELGFDVRHSNRDAATGGDRLFSRWTLFIADNQPLEHRLEELARKVSGLHLRTTPEDELDAHPAIAAVRHALDAGRAAGLGGTRERLTVAVEAAADYVSSPNGLSVASLVLPLLQRGGSPEWALPRELDLAPPELWPEWGESLTQVGRVLAHADPGDTVFADAGRRLLQAAHALRDRDADRTGATRAGMAALVLLPADHPATPPLSEQISDWHLLPFVQESRAGDDVHQILRRALAENHATAAQLADSHRDRLVAAECDALAQVLARAGYHQPIGTPPVPLPEQLTLTAQQLREPDEPHDEDERISGALTRTIPELRSQQFGYHSGPLQRAQLRLRTAEQERAEGTAAAREAARATGTEIASLIEGIDTELLTRARAAGEAGDVASARIHLLRALPRQPKDLLAVGGFPARQMVAVAFHRRALGDLAPSPEWMVRYVHAPNYPLAASVAGNLTTWARELRQRSDGPDELAATLRAAAVSEVADELDALAAGLAQRNDIDLDIPSARGTRAARQAELAYTPPPDPADDQEPDFAAVYEAEGIRFIDGLTGLPALLVEAGWICVDEQPVEIGGIVAQQWNRHETSLGISLDPDDRVVSSVAMLRNGGEDPAEWSEADITDADDLRALVREMGLYGAAGPARVPGLWRIATAGTADEARAIVHADDTARLVTRPADEHEAQWTFADTGNPVPLATPLPRIPGDRQGLLDYVAGDRSRDPEAVDLIAVVVTGTTRKKLTPAVALPRLAEMDEDILRRAITARSGRRHRNKGFDIERARIALERLAEGDPALPLNSHGHRVVLPDPAQPHRVDGVVVGVRPDLNGVAIVIERTQLTEDGRQSHLSRVIDADAVLTLADATSHTTAGEYPPLLPMPPAPGSEIPGSGQGSLFDFTAPTDPVTDGSGTDDTPAPAPPSTPDLETTAGTEANSVNAGAGVPPSEVEFPAVVEPDPEDLEALEEYLAGRGERPDIDTAVDGTSTDSSHDTEIPALTEPDPEDLEALEEYLAGRGNQSDADTTVDAGLDHDEEPVADHVDIRAHEPAPSVPWAQDRDRRATSAGGEEAGRSRPTRQDQRVDVAPESELHLGQEWVRLITEAAEYGYQVRTDFSGPSHVDESTKRILIAAEEAPARRLVALAQQVMLLQLRTEGVLLRPASATPPTQETPAQQRAELVAVATGDAPAPVEFRPHRGHLDLGGHDLEFPPMQGVLDLTDLSQRDATPAVPAPRGRGWIFDEVCRDLGLSLPAEPTNDTNARRGDYTNAVLLRARSSAVRDTAVRSGPSR